MDNLSEKLKDSLRVLDNPYVSSVLSLVIILYASLIAPTLPPMMLALFHNAWVKLAILTLIAYISLKSPAMALIVALGFSITLNTLSEVSIQHQLGDYVQSIPFVGNRLMPQGHDQQPLSGMPPTGMAPAMSHGSMMAGDIDSQNLPDPSYQEGASVQMAHQLPADYDVGSVALRVGSDEGMYMNPTVTNAGCTDFSRAGRLGDYPPSGSVHGYDNLDKYYQMG